MRKKYIVRLTEEERKICDEMIGKLKGSSQKARRARILLKVDADGPGWTDQRVADAFSCRTKTVENVPGGACRRVSPGRWTGSGASRRRCRSCSMASRRRG